MLSVFERAVNILWHDGRLLTLHGPSPLGAPFAAAVSFLPRAGAVTAGGKVCREGGSITIGAVALGWGGAALVDTAVHPVGKGPGSLAVRKGPGPLLAVGKGPGSLATVEDPGLLSTALKGWDWPAGAPGLDSLAGRRARQLCADGLGGGDAAMFIEGACRLIGLGEGLTPAGDDCLVGVLAVLHRFARPWLVQHPEIGSVIAASAETRTTLVGRDFLLHALDGAFSVPVINLVTAPAGQQARRAIARLLAMGATSGADTVQGIRLALSALARQERVGITSFKEISLATRAGLAGATPPGGRPRRGPFARPLRFSNP